MLFDSIKKQNKENSDFIRNSRCTLITSSKVQRYKKIIYKKLSRRYFIETEAKSNTIHYISISLTNTTTRFDFMINDSFPTNLKKKAPYLTYRQSVVRAIYIRLESSTYKVIRLWRKSYSRRTAGVTEKNATFAFSQKKTHTNATFK